jgi:hypothetical protein
VRCGERRRGDFNIVPAKPGLQRERNFNHRDSEASGVPTGARLHTTAVIPRLAGHPVRRRPHGPIASASGILDHPPEPVIGRRESADPVAGDDNLKRPSEWDRMASLYSCFYQTEKRNIFREGTGHEFWPVPSAWADAQQRHRLDRGHLYRRPPPRILSELHSAADARGAVADLGGESVASPMNSTRTAVRAHLLFSCCRMRCITLMILREFVSTMATNSSTAR